MAANIEKLGYGSAWKLFSTDTYEGYSSNMSDYHMHEYYEMSLILSGNVKVFLPDQVQHGTECRIVLTRPMTSHLVVCDPGLLYKRLNLLFSQDFISDCVPEWKQLLGIFGKNGKVIILTESQKEEYYSLIGQFEKEKNVFRKRLILLYLLSKLSEHTESDTGVIEELPAFVADALLYIQENCCRKILSNELAWTLKVGRTTLMTAFKKYTGSTVNNYICDCRLKKAIEKLSEGELQNAVAESCGFGDACNMIRAFRRRFGMTPGQYMKKIKREGKFVG